MITSPPPRSGDSIGNTCQRASANTAPLDPRSPVSRDVAARGEGEWRRVAHLFMKAFRLLFWPSCACRTGILTTRRWSMHR